MYNTMGGRVSSNRLFQTPSMVRHEKKEFEKSMFDETRPPFVLYICPSQYTLQYLFASVDGNAV